MAVGWCWASRTGPSAEEGVTKWDRTEGVEDNWRAEA